MAAVVEWAREAGYPVLGLGVTTTNARAIALYRRLGFVDSGGRFPLRDGSDLEIQIMVRPLDRSPDRPRRPPRTATDGDGRPRVDAAPSRPDLARPRRRP